MVVEYVQYNIGDKMDEDTDYGGDGGDSEDQYGLGTSESGGSVGGYGMPPGGPGVEVNPQGAPLSTSDIFGQPKLDTIPGPSGGGGGASASGMNYQLGLQQLQEQIREFNVQDQARKASAQQAAGGITSLVNEYNQAYAQAVNQYTQDYNQMLGLVQTTTGQQAADIRTQYGNQSAAGIQNLQRLGMGNTTLGTNLKVGVQGQESQALNRLADLMNQQTLGVIAGHKTVSQLAPDPSIVMSALSQGQGASGNYGGLLTQAMGGLGYGIPGSVK